MEPDDLNVACLEAASHGGLLTPRMSAGLKPPNHKRVYRVMKVPLCLLNVAIVPCPLGRSGSGSVGRCTKSNRKQSDAFAQSCFVAGPTLTMMHALAYLGRASDHSE